MTNQELTLSISDNASQLKPSITMAITALANQLREEGKPVIGMSAGEPDFDTPDTIKNAAIKSIQSGKTKYTPAAGIPKLRKAIANKLNQDNGLNYGMENIIVSCGGKHSLYNIFSVLLNPGDEVIIPTPYWVSYPAQVEVCGGKCVYINTTERTNLKVTADQLEAAITPKTKLFVLNSPSNPSGMLYTKHELQELAKVILKHNLFVISDELYEKLVYKGEHVSIASLGDDIFNQTIIVNGVSKAYSMTGWRIGYAAGPAPIVKAMINLQSHSTSNPAQASQWASLEAITGSQDAMIAMKNAFKERRTVLVSGLNSIDGITCIEPEGAFYAFPNISSSFGKTCKSGIITDSVSFCEMLLKESLVACVPGSAFGSDEHIRLSYATSMTNINEALERITTFFNQLSQ